MCFTPPTNCASHIVNVLNKAIAHNLLYEYKEASVLLNEVLNIQGYKTLNGCELTKNKDELLALRVRKPKLPPDTLLWLVMLFGALLWLFPVVAFILS